MGKNKSFLIHYDKYSVLKKQMHNTLLLLVVCESSKLDYGSLYDIVEEIETNFKEIDKVVEHIEKND